jgi:Rrf2 family transcriptional regulator, iron-sulfur cluster assembly transcription factor
MLKLTNRVHYSVKALLDLSLQPPGTPASVRAIAERQELPAPYLEKLLIELRRAGIVHAVRGAQGGYCLARPAREICLGQILKAVGETIPPLIETQPEAAQVEDWVTYSLWNRLNLKLQEAVDSISLEDLYFDARSWQASQGNENNFII